MAAPSVKSGIEDYISGFNDSSAKDIAKCVIEQTISLTDIIENLGKYLTNKETSVRARATRCVSDILLNLPSDFLTEKQVCLLGTYLCERLKDHHSLQPHALVGLLALCKAKHLSNGVIDSTCRTIFKEAHVQSLPQAERRVVFNIFLTLLTTRPEDVQTLGTDFVYGYIQAMDSEKDPRNLILAFNCAYIIIQNLPLGVFVEEMFEVVSCYFPIDFTPSTNDPSGISKEDLVLALRRCLAATPRFAQYCLPLLMEKLTSDLKTAKIDSLETLAVCAETFGMENLSELQSSFFNCIKKEVFLSGDSGVEEASLKTLQALVKALSTGVIQSNKKNNLEGFVEEILSECKNHLLQPELMLMVSSGRLLQSVAMASESACCLVTKAAVPVLVETYNLKTQPTQQHNVIQVLNWFLQATANFQFNNKNPNPVLSDHKDPILLIYSQALETSFSSLQALAVQGLHILLSLPPACLLDTERTFVAAKLVNVATRASVENIVREKCSETLRLLLSKYADTVQDTVLPVIFTKLQNEEMEVDGSDIVSRPALLETLAAITCGVTTVSQVIDLLCTLIHKEENIEMTRAVTRCLSRIAEMCAGDIDSVAVLCEKGVTAIHDLVVTKCRCDKWRKRLTDAEVMANLAAFLRHVAISLTPQQLSEVQSRFVGSYLSQQMGSAAGDQQPEFSPLQAGRDTVFVGLLIPVVCVGTQQTSFPHIDSLVQRLSTLVTEQLETNTHTHVCKCLAALLNKLPPDSSLDVKLTDLQTGLTSQIASSPPDHHAVTTLAWLTKALVLRNHPLATQFTNQMVDLLGKKEVGEAAAQGFHIILTECEDVLNRATGANIRLMYRQRFFLENLPKLVEGYKTAREDVKKHYLVAVSHLIKGLNKQVLIPELPRIYPLLIQSLMCEDIDLQLATMVTLGDLITAAPDLVQSQMDSVLPQLLSLTTYKPSMKVRIAALKCIGELTSLPLTVLLPYRSKVTRALVPVLDDKKRLVRAQAVEARHSWFLLDTSK